MSSSVQHLPPLCCSEVSSQGQRGLGEVPQEDAALEPEPVQSQQAAGVCRQPGPGAQHGLGGVLTSHAHISVGQKGLWAVCVSGRMILWCYKVWMLHYSTLFGEIFFYCDEHLQTTLKMDFKGSSPHCMNQRICFISQQAFMYVYHVQHVETIMSSFEHQKGWCSL